LKFNYTFTDENANSTITLLATTDNETYTPISVLSHHNTPVSFKQSLAQMANSDYIRLLFPINQQNNSSFHFVLQDFSIYEGCPAVENLVINNIAADNATIDFDYWGQESNFEVVIMDSNNNVLSSLTANSHPITIPFPLPVQSSYIIGIRTACEYDTADFVYLTIDLAQQLSCQTPTDFHAQWIEAKGDEIISCQWTAETAICELQWKENLEMGWHSLTIPNNGFYNFRNMDLNKEYMFRIRSVCEDNLYSLWSDTARVSTNGLNDIEKINRVNIFPNPATTEINISSNIIDISAVKMTDNRGRIIYQWTKIPKTINVSALKSGIYYLRFEFGKGILVKKLIIE
jgi:hypothetical protein